MAKHVDITGWDKHKIGNAYMDAIVKLELVERRLKSMTLADGTAPETRFRKHTDEIRGLTNQLKNLKQDFKNFKVITLAHMDWMSTDIKWKENQLNQELQVGSNTVYSKELTAAIAFTDKLKGE